jgi:hypothetical protein
VKADGGSCGAQAQRGRPYCFQHDPDQAEAAADARRRGAGTTNKRRRRTQIRTADPSDVPARLESVEDAIAWAAWAARAVATGEVDARTGKEVGGLLKVFLDGKKHADSVDKRVKELREKIRQLQGVA